MATEFNPGGPIEKDAAARRTINPLEPAREGRSWGMIIAIAALVVFGMVFSMRPNTTASNVGPGATTGTTTGASPSNPPTVRSPQGQGESNSTR